MNFLSVIFESIYNQTMDTKPPESGPFVQFFVLCEFIGTHNISISPEGINQAIIIRSLKFVMSARSDARCSGTSQASTPSISITRVTLGELHFPCGRWRGKAIMQVAFEIQGAGGKKRERPSKRN